MTIDLRSSGWGWMAATVTGWLLAASVFVSMTLYGQLEESRRHVTVERMEHKQVVEQLTRCRK